MTHVAGEKEGNNEAAVVVPELKLRIQDKYGDYMKLSRNAEGSEPEVLNVPEELEPSTPRIKYGFFCKWAKFLLLFTFVGVLVAVFFTWIGPLLMDKSWLEKYPKNASIIRLAGEGDWFHQFRAVVLIRVSPFPYIIYNYCAVATNVKYGPYFLGSLVGTVPDVFIAIYTGILIRTLADASHGQHYLSAEQIIFNILGFLVAAATTILCTIFAKRRLNRLQMEEEVLLQ
ncbi:hypothetical protein Ancab_032524 [Ancistrocladus abbreviatus]